MQTNLSVTQIPNRITHEWLLHKHYAHSIPSISFSFGLFEIGFLIGIVTYGTPPSSPLRKGIAGERYSSIVVELNRLVINDDAPDNSASFLVARSIRLLPAPKIIVSYADCSQGHVGYVYQATNFLYTGLSAKRTNWHIEGENLHGYTIADKSRGKENRSEYMRKIYGDKFSLVPRSRKHRYLFIYGNKKQRNEIMLSLRYKILPYPKGDSLRYDASYITSPYMQSSFAKSLEIKTEM